MPPGPSHREWSKWLHNPSVSAEQRQLRATFSKTAGWARERARERAREAAAIDGWPKFRAFYKDNGDLSPVAMAGRAAVKQAEAATSEERRDLRWPHY